MISTVVCTLEFVVYLHFVLQYQFSEKATKNKMDNGCIKKELYRTFIQLTIRIFRRKLWIQLDPTNPNIIKVYRFTFLTSTQA